MNGLMEENTKDSGRTGRCMEKENLHGLMANAMKEITLMIRDMAKESIPGSSFSKFNVYRPDQTRYEGEFKNGKQHGTGIIYDAQNKPQEGVWENGKLKEAGNL